MVSKKNLYSLIVLLTFSQSIQAILSLCSKNKMCIDSMLNAQDSIELNCGKLFTGSGTIQGPKVLIIVQTFEFKGTIDCDGECVIICAALVEKDEFGKSVVEKVWNLDTEQKRIEFFER